MYNCEIHNYCNFKLKLFSNVSYNRTELPPWNLRELAKIYAKYNQKRQHLVQLAVI